MTVLQLLQGDDGTIELGFNGTSVEVTAVENGELVTYMVRPETLWELLSDADADKVAKVVTTQ